MKASIISVGTELLMGEITNTNTVYLSQKLNDHGVDVLYHHTVGDNPGRLTHVLEKALEDTDLIITTGGLGPTQDDMTKEVVCQVFDDELIMNDDWLQLLHKRYEERGSVLTENNFKQAMLPSRAEILWNEKGSAPGFILTCDRSGTSCSENSIGKTICCLPGPPREMKWLFEEKAEPILFQGAEEVLIHRMIRTFGIGESRMETELMDLIDGQNDPTIATYAKTGECAIRIASKRSSREEAEKAVDDMIDKIKDRIGEYIYSTDDEELVDVVSRQLLDKGITISSAESCTGGLFASTLIDIPGISAVFDRSLVTYSNNAKIEELGVKPETLEKHGAVSEETALEMAEGIRRASGSDVGISSTGIAGPDGGTDEKPVGLVYIGFVFGDKKMCRRITWNTRGRNTNRQYAVLNMLDLIRCST